MGDYPRKSLEQRLWVKIDFSGDCWEWTASLAKGYGRISVATGKWRVAHRVVYEILVGPIPAGLELDHLCRNRACVNPDHLEPVTTRTNLLRGYSPWARRARQTHCKRGHEFTPENTYGTGDGRRYCRTCRRAYHQQARAVAA